MIIEAILNVILYIFSALTIFIHLPELPESLLETILYTFEYITLGFSILSNYCHLSYLGTLFGIVLAVDLGLSTYKLVMFLLRKIPFFGVQ